MSEKQAKELLISLFRKVPFAIRYGLDSKPIEGQPTDAFGGHLESDINQIVDYIIDAAVEKMVEKMAMRKREEESWYGYT